MKKTNFQEIKKELPGIRKNVPLKNFTTFKIGGPAKYFFPAKNKNEMIKAILAAKKLKLPFFILGGGSNILISDKGFKGMVIKIENRQTEIRGCCIRAEAGAQLARVVTVAKNSSLTGMEWAKGIYGTVGGAVRGSAGAFGKGIADVLETAEVMNLKTGEVSNFSRRECCFEYRESIFKKNKNLIIVSVGFKLRKGDRKKIEEKMKEYREYREARYPLNFPSAGSVFMNHRLTSELIKKFPQLKDFNEKKQIPAAWLIERCGLKGKRIGRAQISEKHANFIVNLGKGRATDVKKLINFAKQAVKKKFKIILKEEIQYLGFEN